MTEKDKKIIADAEKNNTPIFVLTAKDKNSTGAIADYLNRCADTNCDDNHIVGIDNRRIEFLSWQNENANLVKFPD